MSLVSLSLVFLAAQTAAAAYRTCPIPGPDFPLPTDLTSSARLSGVFDKFTKVFEDSLASGTSDYGPVDNSSSYAIQFFSIDDEEPIYEHYFTSEAVKKSAYGVNEVKGDSIFRVGSISKLLTVYTLLAEVGDAYWNVPLTDVIPELRSYVEESVEDPVRYIAWDSITLGALAGQLSGLPHDIVSTGDISYLLMASNQDPTDYGLPQLSASEYPICQVNATQPCTRQDFFNKAIDSRRPNWAPNTFSAYSDTNYQVLAYALESIVGTPFPALFNHNIIQRLNLHQTSYTIPPSTSQGVIPIDPSSSYWNADLNDATPMGGNFASATDLSTIGRSILSSRILDANTTRAWLKPTSFTGSLTNSVGRPWEIFRQEGIGAPNRVTDYYTKGGDIGMYHSGLMLLPDYGVGFTVLVAGDGGPEPVEGMIAETVTAGLEAVAREQAAERFGGTYEAGGGVNSTITLTTDPEMPGMGVEPFVANGSAILQNLAALNGVSFKDSIVRLYPTNLEKSLGDGMKEVSFQMVFDRAPGYVVKGPIVECNSFNGVDTQVYGQKSLNQLIFTVDEKTGKAVRVRSPALQVTMEKVV